MSIKPIPRSEFDRLQTPHTALESLMGEQVECFSNKSESVLGFIAKGAGVAGWNYAILKRDKKGDFHVRKVRSNFFSLKDARVDLLLLMTGIEKIDGANHGTTNPWLPSVPTELFALNPER
jgi:hypothetical protein